MKVKIIKNIPICLSVFTNVVLVCTLVVVPLSYAKRTSQQKEQKDYRLQNDIEYNQLFYGRWIIKNCILPNSGLPRSYSAFDENGALTGGNEEFMDAIIGEEIVFESGMYSIKGTCK